MNVKTIFYLDNLPNGKYVRGWGTEGQYAVPTLWFIAGKAQMLKRLLKPVSMALLVALVISAFGASTVLSQDITNLPASWDFGSVAEGSSAQTALDEFTVTNDSDFAINITISGSDMTGGTAWTLSDTGEPGDNIYGLWVGLSGGDYTIIVKKNSPYNALVTGLAASGTQDWGLKLLAPTTFSDGVQKTGIVTLTATAS